MNFEYFPKWTVLAWLIVLYLGPTLLELRIIGIMLQIWLTGVTMFVVLENYRLQNQNQIDDDQARESIPRAAQVFLSARKALLCFWCFTLLFPSTKSPF